MAIKIFVAKLPGKCVIGGEEVLGKRVLYNKDKQLVCADHQFPSRAKGAQTATRFNASFIPSVNEGAGASRSPNAPVASALNASSKTQTKVTSSAVEVERGVGTLTPTPLSTERINQLYENARRMLEVRGFEPTPDLMAVSLKIQLEQAVESFWINYTKWEHSLKEANRKAWKGA
jgi:hypothetical protein